MADNAPKLTPEQRAALRRRWEGSPIEGFDWLSAECLAAWGVRVSRQALRKGALKAGWAKGGEPSQPLADAPGPGDEVVDGKPTGRVAEPARVVPLRRRQAATAQPATGVVAQLPAVAQPADGEVFDDDGPVDQPTGSVSAASASAPARRGMPGRPGLYRPEYAQRIIDYFNVEATVKETVAGLGGATRIQIVAQTPPTLVRFAQGVGVSVETLGRWATDVDDDGRPRYPDFADAYARARNLLESLLIEGATLGVYDSRVVQFTLKNWYGWKDQPDKDVAVAPVSAELLDTLYIQRMAAARERQARVIEERARLRLQEGEGGA